MSTEPLLSVKEVAAMLGVSDEYVYRHTTRGESPKIPYVPIGGIKFRRESVMQFIRELERA